MLVLKLNFLTKIFNAKAKKERRKTAEVEHVCSFRHIIFPVMRDDYGRRAVKACVRSKR